MISASRRRGDGFQMFLPNKETKVVEKKAGRAKRTEDFSCEEVCEPSIIFEAKVGGVRSEPDEGTVG